MIPTTQSYECTVVLLKHWVEVTRTLYVEIWAVEAQNGGFAEI